MKWYSPFNPFAYWRKYKQIRQDLQESRRARLEQMVFEQYELERPGLLARQEAIFTALGLDYQAAQARVQRVLRKSGELRHICAEFDNNMFSEHWVLFAAMKPEKVRRVLELGTFNGEFTRFLSILFPDAEIVTMDLPDDDPVFIGSYCRDDDERRRRFLAHREKMLARPNIKFVQKNTFFLPSLQLGTFDCIWVDACHEYPDVAWDICNAWHCCNVDGWIACDDIYLSDTPAGGNTNASRDALLALSRYRICDVHFILKRFSPKFSASPHVRKHVGI